MVESTLDGKGPEDLGRFGSLSVLDLPGSPVPCSKPRKTLEDHLYTVLSGVVVDDKDPRLVLDTR